MFLGIEGREGGCGTSLGGAVESRNLVFFASCHAHLPRKETGRPGTLGTQKRGQYWVPIFSLARRAGGNLLFVHMARGRHKPGTWWERVEWAGVGLATVLSGPGQPGFVSSP